jgi:hypothetical protein
MTFLEVLDVLYLLNYIFLNIRFIYRFRHTISLSIEDAGTIVL